VGAARPGPATPLFRPQPVALPGAGGAGFEARVESVIARGPSTRLECAVDGKIIEIDWNRGPLPDGVGRGGTVRLAPRRFTIFPS
jgi:hypothetical protein